eukprot:TRINITY_DN38663_c0_g1_i2.p1 TRINITY_DN38663_c0_g1~~TRINITY_DN38663_c0_g1_i2.p1  ORF type:complete len:817 (+),score=253.33 TRINITY_DN38663_c0_g1_i2:113-2563(+)
MDNYPIIEPHVLHGLSAEVLKTTEVDLIALMETLPQESGLYQYCLGQYQTMQDIFTQRRVEMMIQGNMPKVEEYNVEDVLVPLEDRIPNTREDDHSMPNLQNNQEQKPKPNSEFRLKSTDEPPPTTASYNPTQKERRPSYESFKLPNIKTKKRSSVSKPKSAKPRKRLSRAQSADVSKRVEPMEDLNDIRSTTARSVKTNDSQPKSKSKPKKAFSQTPNSRLYTKKKKNDSNVMVIASAGGRRKRAWEVDKAKRKKKRERTPSPPKRTNMSVAELVGKSHAAEAAKRRKQQQQQKPPLPPPSPSPRTQLHRQQPRPSNHSKTSTNAPIRSSIASKDHSCNNNRDKTNKPKHSNSNNIPSTPRRPRTNRQQKLQKEEEKEKHEDSATSDNNINTTEAKEQSHIDITPSSTVSEPIINENETTSSINQPTVDELAKENALLKKRLEALTRMAQETPQGQQIQIISPNTSSNSNIIDTNNRNSNTTSYTRIEDSLAPTPEDITSAQLPTSKISDSNTTSSEISTSQDLYPSESQNSGNIDNDTTKSKLRDNDNDDDLSIITKAEVEDNNLSKLNLPSITNSPSPTKIKTERTPSSITTITSPPVMGSSRSIVPPLDLSTTPRPHSRMRTTLTSSRANRPFEPVDTSPFQNDMISLALDTCSNSNNDDDTTTTTTTAIKSPVSVRLCETGRLSERLSLTQAAMPPLEDLKVPSPRPSERSETFSNKLGSPLKIEQNSNIETNIEEKIPKEEEKEVRKEVEVAKPSKRRTTKAKNAGSRHYISVNEWGVKEEDLVDYSDFFDSFWDIFVSSHSQAMKKRTG